SWRGESDAGDFLVRSPALIRSRFELFDQFLEIIHNEREAFTLGSKLQQMLLPIQWPRYAGHESIRKLCICRHGGVLDYLSLYFCQFLETAIERHGTLEQIR